VHRTQRFHPSVQIVEFAVAPPHLPRLAVGATRTNHDGAHAVCRVLAIACAHCLSHARCDDQLAVLAKLTAICTGDCAGDRVSGPGQAYCSVCPCDSRDGIAWLGGGGAAAQTWHFRPRHHLRCDLLAVDEKLSAVALFGRGCAPFARAGEHEPSPLPSAFPLCRGCRKRHFCSCPILRSTPRPNLQTEEESAAVEGESAGSSQASRPRWRSGGRHQTVRQ
jgi:hypothetical protein